MILWPAGESEVAALVDISKTEIIAGLLERIGRMQASDGHSQGLMPVHWEALRYLERANRISRTLMSLTAYLGVTKGTLSQTLKALEGRGLITRTTDPKDKRSKRLALTAQGRELLQQDPLRDWRDAMSQLSEAAQDELHDLLSSVLQSLLTGRDRVPFGVCRRCIYFEETHEMGSPHYCQQLQMPLLPGNADQICVEMTPAE